MTEANKCDLVVVGCGTAGLSAAVTAAEKGLDVILLERAPYEERGGNSRYTEAFMRMQSFDEVADDFEQHISENAGGYLDPSIISDAVLEYENWPRLLRSASFADPHMVGAFSEAAGPTIRWMMEHGVSFDFLPTPFLTTCTPRLSPRGGGLAIIEQLTGAAEKLGVRFCFETTASELVVDEAGDVQGVHVRGPNNRYYQILAPSVVLACGGFEGNPQMLAHYLGPNAINLRPVARGGHYNKGEGIRMALAAGAAACGDFGSYHAEPIDPRSGEAEAAIFIFPYGILVNKQGRRFVDEAPGTVDATYESVTRKIYDQEDGLAWVILDERVEEVPNWQLAVRTDQPAVTAQTVEALAHAIDVPEEVLSRTIADYNSACREPQDFQPLSLDGNATTGLYPPKSNWALPLDKPGFRAYPIISANVFTFGGVKVDAHARVVNTDGDVMTGLYAAGEVVGLYYRVYTGSTSVLKAALFGRLAGLHAASRGDSAVNT
ncbi:MAG: FAD-dependent tricarballylate dehydrogenase TcuA [Pseudomonadota bacterium]